MPDQGALFAPLAKAIFTATDPDEAVAMAADAIAVAQAAPAGPVYLGVPSDVLGAAAGAGSAASPTGARTAPDLRAVEAAAALLEPRGRVVIWAGGGCVAAGAEQAVTDLAWRLGRPS